MAAVQDAAGTLNPTVTTAPDALRPLARRRAARVRDAEPLDAEPDAAAHAHVPPLPKPSRVAPGHRPWDDAVKRGVDLLLIAAGSVVLLPVLTLTAIAIRLDTPGPVFYTQRRCGRHGRRFPVYKFRTMVTDADDVLRHYLDEHPELLEEWNRTHKLKGDPRITRVGRWLRRASLDELPQVLNVVRGEMSLVGPRPITDEELRKYGPRRRQYEAVVPGVTGLWQVSGRNDLCYERRVRLDAWYARRRTLRLDLMLLLKTVPAVLGGRGAY